MASWKKIAGDGRKTDKKLFILTFDLEEWFHIIDVDTPESRKSWDEYEVRIYENTHRILGVLDRNNIKATIFVLGWIAQKYPDLISEISSQGHEIGTHSLNHNLMYEVTPDTFREDLRKSIDIIQNIINKKVKAFRAPGFSINKKTFWAFDILAEEGIEIDSSIFPVYRAYGGIRDFDIDRPFRVKIGEKTIKEFPINVFKLGKLKIPFSGGGYFRNLPFRVYLYFSDRSDYLITYFHPRDFDPDQPVLNRMRILRKFKIYRGLKKSLKRFNEIIQRYNFVNISEAERIIDWSEAPLVSV